MRASTKAFLLILITGSALCPPALAQDVPPVVKALLDSMEQQVQVKPTYGAVTDENGTIKISKLSIVKTGTPEQPAGVSMTVDEIALSNVTDKGNGLFEVGQASFQNMKMDVLGAEQPITITLPQGSAEGWYFKADTGSSDPAEALRASMNIANKMSSGPISISTMGQTITSDGYTATWNGDPQTGAGKFSSKLSNLLIPESTLAIVDPQGTLKQLGYTSLSFDMTADGDMALTDNKLGMNLTMGVSGKDMGGFTMSFDAKDLPLKVLSILREARASGKEPDLTAVMPELQNALLNSASLKFTDSSITKRLLPLVAAAQGTDEATLVANAGAMVQVSLMQLNNQAFTQQVSTAVSNFLKDPKSITVSMAPAQPVKVQELMTLDQTNPADAINKLGISVTAND